jgi:hypothetical protein
MWSPEFGLETKRWSVDRKITMRGWIKWTEHEKAKDRAGSEIEGPKMRGKLSFGIPEPAHFTNFLGYIKVGGCHR